LSGLFVLVLTALQVGENACLAIHHIDPAVKRTSSFTESHTPHIGVDVSQRNLLATAGRLEVLNTTLIDRVPLQG